jgi:hypothetical protein
VVVGREEVAVLRAKETTVGGLTSNFPATQSPENAAASLVLFEERVKTLSCTCLG